MNLNINIFDFEIVSEIEKGNQYILKMIDGGKKVANNVYFHTSFLSSFSELISWFDSVHRLLNHAHPFNVIRISNQIKEIAFLEYINFYTDPFPKLNSSLLLNLSDLKTSFSEFGNQNNPPILHRKELLLGDGDPYKIVFEKLTQELEDLGAYDQASHTIGRKDNWNCILANLGITIVDHQVRLSEQDKTVNIIRHRTAISRTHLSSPVQALLKWGFINENISFFDYGCGRGDDIKILTKSGINSNGWDPYFYPENQIFEADVVNLGFVLNVIENINERGEALQKAFSLCGTVLSVGVILAGRVMGEKIFDGVVTTKNTFQKYFQQSELHNYIKRVLNRDPISIGQGIFFVFKNDIDEQDFLSKRQKKKTITRDYLDSIFLISSEKTKKSKGRREPKPSIYEVHQNYFDDFWEKTLELGRFPEIDEFPYIKDISDNPKKLFRELPFNNKNIEFEEAKYFRKNDLLVYLCLNLFENRKSFSSLSKNIQRDIRFFFGSHSLAISEAKKFLFSLSSLEKLLKTFKFSEDTSRGIVASDGDYSFYIDKLAEQEPEIRVLVGCAEKLDSIPIETQIIKIHAHDKSISFLIFDDFKNEPLPRLVQRLRVDLKRQRVLVDFFSKEFDQRVFFGKSAFIPENFFRYASQKRFDDKLFQLGIFSRPGLGGNFKNLGKKLSDSNVKLTGFRIFNSKREN